MEHQNKELRAEMKALIDQINDVWPRAVQAAVELGQELDRLKQNKSR